MGDTVILYVGKEMKEKKERVNISVTIRKF